MENAFRPDQNYSQLRLWAPAVAVMVTLVISSHFSGKPAGPNIMGFDKVAHFFVFGLLGTLLFRSLRMEFRAAQRWLLAFAGVMAYAAADETLQFFNPNRSFDPWDWVADGAGALLAIFLYRNWKVYRGILEYKFGRRLAK
ncbi:VanZ family protein [Pelagicoccus enzymogenes]|uniref:VanZ family protein n=1 Tax=Pelagicoccus enzymogenes TaxID=2773457 RepID=UPI0028115FF6|nr:VanZ family protein [Pelagicoccus enzymogenes]